LALLVSEMVGIRRVSCGIMRGMSVDPDEELLFRDLLRTRPSGRL
jgi:hypothetical protein